MLHAGVLDLIALVVAHESKNNTKHMTLNTRNVGANVKYIANSSRRVVQITKLIFCHVRALKMA